MAFESRKKLPSGHAWVQLHTGDPGPKCDANFSPMNRRYASFDVLTGLNDKVVSWEYTLVNATYTHVSFWTAGLGGHSLDCGPLTIPKSVIAGNQEGDHLDFLVGSLDVGETNRIAMEKAARKHRKYLKKQGLWTQ